MKVSAYTKVVCLNFQLGVYVARVGLGATPVLNSNKAANNTLEGRDLGPVTFSKAIEYKLVLHM